MDLFNVQKKGSYIPFLLLIVGAMVSCTQRPTSVKEEIKKIRIDQETAYRWSKDIGVFKSELNGEMLKLNIGNRKSCGRSDDYQMVTNLTINKTNPPQLRMVLYNASETEACKSDTALTLNFDLGPLKGTLDFDEVVLNINGKNSGLYKLK